MKTKQQPTAEEFLCLNFCESEYCRVKPATAVCMQMSSLQKAAFVLAVAVLLMPPARHWSIWPQDTDFLTLLIFHSIFFVPLLFLIWAFGWFGPLRQNSPGGAFLVIWLACTLLLYVFCLVFPWASSIAPLYSTAASLRVATTVAAANGALVLVLRLLGAPLNALTVSVPAFVSTAAGLLFVPLSVSETYLRSNVVENLWPAAFGGLLISYVLTVQSAAHERERQNLTSRKLMESFAEPTDRR
ncbi:hypothetical protein [Gloeobacter morelensis]|uniref:Uncharacterized protein n=1 Tax=Gloeobacter morelensis MG652769 TaxID=2781736 RepID=A0ABY3PK50_9CYAN|nr:hypothetical protein [Gloeobacter morelensis]UFP94051.1 hypothetical protein ISF26_20150 [Gloeobacter morelensis MG652769]